MSSVGVHLRPPLNLHLLRRTSPAPTGLRPELGLAQFFQPGDQALCAALSYRVQDGGNSWSLTGCCGGSDLIKPHEPHVASVVPEIQLRSMSQNSGMHTPKVVRR